jgi:hypothetical protein
MDGRWPGCPLTVGFERGAARLTQLTEKLCSDLPRAGSNAGIFRPACERNPASERVPDCGAGKEGHSAAGAMARCVPDNMSVVTQSCRHRVPRRVS